MPLFKYMSIDSAERYFGNSMLKASRPKDFNDVLDAYPVLPHVPEAEIYEWARVNTDRKKEQNRLMTGADGDTEDPYDRTYRYELGWARKMASEERATFDELYRQDIYRFVCFCRSGRHPLMWTHYAGNHEGVQLEFDENHECFKDKLHSVVYSEERPILGLDEMRRIITDARDPKLTVPSFFLSKALEWAYEQEVRLCLRKSETSSSGPVNPISLYKVPFDALQSVSFGARYFEKKHHLTELVSSVAESEGLDIKTYWLRISSTEYKLEKQEMQLAKIKQ